MSEHAWGPFYLGSITDCLGNEIEHEAFITVGSPAGQEEDAQINIAGAHAKKIARLIVAATDMLGLCKTILRGIEANKLPDQSLIRRSKDDEVEIDSLKRRLQTIIAKAEGREP